MTLECFVELLVRPGVRTSTCKKDEENSDSGRHVSAVGWRASRCLVSLRRGSPSKCGEAKASVTYEPIGSPHERQRSHAPLFRFTRSGRPGEVRDVGPAGT